MVGFSSQFSPGSLVWSGQFTVAGDDEVYFALLLSGGGTLFFVPLFSDDEAVAIGAGSARSGGCTGVHQVPHARLPDGGKS
jgi:hypothetical protein